MNITQENHTAAKAFLFHDNKILILLRDNKPEISFPNMWDLPGGKREENESAVECLIRETNEEFSIRLEEDQIFWNKEFEALLYPGRKMMMYAGNLNEDQISSIILGDEGQEWKFVDIDEFLNMPDMIPHFIERLKVFLVENKD